MTSYAREVWSQLRNKTIQDIAKALKKDGWSREETIGATQGYRKNGNRVVLHIHPKAIKGRKLLKKMLDDIGWSECDMRRLKLIK